MKTETVYIKRLCSDALPTIGDNYFVGIDTAQDNILETICEYFQYQNGNYDWDLGGVRHFGGFREEATVIWWLEPVQRIVMTEEELKKLLLFTMEKTFDFALYESKNNLTVDELYDLYLKSKEA